MTEIVVKDTALEVLFDGLQNLKQAGGHMSDGRLLWCSNSLLHGTSTAGQQSSHMVAEDSPTTARSVLTRIKTASKALSCVAKSLDDAIQRIADRYSPAFREIGFKSLPDDVLARIFELHHEISGDRSTVFVTWKRQTISSTHTLANVCTRFRNIALRIPFLWEVVSDRHEGGWIKDLKGRTRHPSVHVQTKLSKRTLAEFFQLLHPPEQWKELHAHYISGSCFRALFQYISSEFNGRLDGLKTLRLIRHQYSSSEMHGQAPSTMLSAEDHQLLSQWKLDRLERLIVKNMIPKTLSCSNLREFDLELTRSDPAFFWSLSALKEFLEDKDVLESFSISLSDSGTFPPSFSDETDFNPAKLMKLTSFTLKIVNFAETIFVSDLMHIWDAPILSDLNISLHDTELSTPEQLLNAVFLPPIWVQSPIEVRPFPNVKKFTLLVQETPQRLPYKRILQALPNVRDLIFELPNCAEPDLGSLEASKECLQELRSLRLKNCAAMTGHGTTRFVTKQVAAGKLEAFEVESRTGFAERKEELQKVLGDRLIWKS